MRLVRLAEATAPPVLALLATVVAFALFLLAAGADPLQAYGLIYLGAFGTWFSWQNTLVRAAPLLLTALGMALPAQIGLIVIGAEGGFVAGGVAAIAAGLPLAALGLPAIFVLTGMALAGMATGAALVAACGALRHWRGVNETISSLLIAYISIAVCDQLVEGAMRDPASLNKPSTRSLPDALMLGTIPGTNIHLGLVLGLVFCVLAYVFVFHTTWGFAARVVGANARAGRLVGLPVGRLILIVTALAGMATGLAGMVEVAAVQGAASADLAVGYGYTGILVAFLARQNPLAVIPVAVLMGGLEASGGLLEQRLQLPDATITVLRGLLFIMLLASETLQGKLRLKLRPRAPRAAPEPVRPAQAGGA